jgi:membrane fusion protein, multidrug efflux system
MSRILKWIIGVIVAAAAIAGLTFAFIEGRDEIAREREKEAPIKIAPRISRTPEGDVVVTIDRETQQRMGLQSAEVAAESIYPEVLAYGRVQEDPDASFVVRAAVSGIVRGAPGRNWPMIGEPIADGTSIGTVEPRLAPIERVDLTTRLSDARADIEAAEARVTAARAAFERARTLNADNKNISDRAVQEAESALKGEEAKLAAARRNVAELEAATTRQSAGTTPVPLVVARGGDVVEVLARPNEAIESGQPILRVTRFDTLLARVDVPAGETIDRNLTVARIISVGQEDHPFEGRRISVAPTVDPTTPGEGFLFRISGAGPSLRPGAPVLAYLRAPGAAQQGVVVPYSAIVRSAGKTWVYRQIADEKFARREVGVDRTSGKGVLTRDNLKTGERIVVKGAQFLLSEEQKSEIQVGDEAEGK